MSDGGCGCGSCHCSRDKEQVVREPKSDGLTVIRVP